MNSDFKVSQGGGVENHQKVKKVLDEVGMKITLEALIESMDEAIYQAGTVLGADTAYLYVLRHNLTEAYRSYEARYDNDE